MGKKNDVLVGFDLSYVHYLWALHLIIVINGFWTKNLFVEREFDADKHCGVWVAELQKQCTRSLTCKVGI